MLSWAMKARMSRPNVTVRLNRVMPLLDENMILSRAGIMHSEFIKNRPVMFSTFGSTLNMNSEMPRVWQTSTINV